MTENLNKPISVKLTRRTVTLAKQLKEQFELHSIEETVYLALKLMKYLRIKDGIGKGELWQIAGYSTKDFALEIRLKADVAKPMAEIKPIPVSIKEIAKNV